MNVTAEWSSFMRMKKLYLSNYVNIVQKGRGGKDGKRS
ncbi:hypothetical protein H4683_002260 [Filibacter limicola]|uniref:Uncharacterized protein n=1 Tax=Sporosarcina limicola TaxID=34101 RepID=A0A927MPU1_9BACL|nr:hypothetical protein [Sporosarcina limicola]